jgi:hypothetical protein
MFAASRTLATRCFRSFSTTTLALDGTNGINMGIMEQKVKRVAIGTEGGTLDLGETPVFHSLI